MVTIVDRLNVQFNVMTKKAEAELRKMDRLYAEIDKTLARSQKAQTMHDQQLLKQQKKISSFMSKFHEQELINKRIDMQTESKKLKQTEKLQRNLDKQFNQMIAAKEQKMQSFFQATQKLLLSVGLAFLFTGMALKRFFETAVTSLLKLYMDMEGAQGPVSEKVNELKARIFAVGHSLFDAFKDSGMLDKWLDRINWFIDKIEGLDEGTKAWLVNASIWGAIVATAMMVIGMALLFLLAPLAAIEFMMGSKLVAAVGRFMWALMGNPLTWFILALGIVLIGLWRMKDAMGGVGNFFKAVFAGMAKVVAWFAGTMLSLLLGRIEKLLVIGSKVASAIPGMDGLSSKLSGYAQDVSNFRIKHDAGDLMEKVDKLMGMNDIRDNMESTSLMDMLIQGKQNYNNEQGSGFGTQQQVNNVVIQGNADQATIDAAIRKLKEEIALNQGSPQR